MTPHILVADGERSIRSMLETGLTLNGFRVTCVRSSQEAMKAAVAGRFDAVLSDIYMPDGSGLDLVAKLRGAGSTIPIVLMTAQGSIDVAVQAVSSGASDFIGKPFEIAVVVALLRRYVEARREADAPEAGGRLESELSRSGIVGRSAPMVMVYKLIAQAARTDATVLIIGESGTGKELVARAIHEYSNRASRPFLGVNCSGLTDTLLESELFGYTRGAFTGAAADRAGLFEAADGGTLFLDELGSTSPAFQASLLRVLQSGEIRRVGSTHLRTVNVRVIAATNTPLQELLAARSLRTDLYYRLSVLSVELPPLRERASDLPLLTEHFLRQFSPPDAPAPHLSTEARQILMTHPFPGNVRELENALKRAVALSAGDLITIDCLPPGMVAAASDKTLSCVERRLVGDRPGMEELQRRYLELILEETAWNRRAAAVLQLDRRTIQRLIARYRLQGASHQRECAADLEDEPGHLDRENFGEQGNDPLQEVR